MKLLLLSILCLEVASFSSNLQRARPTAFGVAKYQQNHYRRSLETTTALRMFGGMFGGDGKEDGELALYTNLGSDDSKFSSLSDYVQKWSQLFDTDPKGMKLTTPVQVLPSHPGSLEEGVTEANGVRLVFKSTATGYQSKQEEATPGSDGAPKKKKQKEKLQGGVEILVEKLSSGAVQVRARRCDMDEDTTIKEMSEESILGELQRALDVWKRETS